MFEREILSVRELAITQAGGTRKTLYKAFFALPDGDVCYLNTDKPCRQGDHCVILLRLNKERILQAYIADVLRE